MTNSVEADQVPRKYAIQVDGEERFILAQPCGERITVHEKPGIAKITAIALTAGGILAFVFLWWLFHLDLSK